MAKILIADDSITVRKVAERLLTDAGMEVALVSSGEEALSWLQKERPDFIISDVIMPDKSGYDVCRFVRSQAELSTTPVLLISGVVNDEVNRQAQSCQADAVLKKPFQGTSLKDCVLELLAKRRQEAPEAPAEAVATQAADAPATVAETQATEAEAPAPAELPAAASVRFAFQAAPATPEPPASTPAPEIPTSPAKVYRITEQQLDAFRKSTGRIKELEAALADEHAKAARFDEIARRAAEAEQRIKELSSEDEGARHWRARARELEESVATERARAVELAQRLDRQGAGEGSPHAAPGSDAALLERLAEMERAVANANARIEQMARVLSQIATLAGGAAQE